MLELIAFIIFVISAGGMLFILFKKIPVLTDLPKNGHHGLKKNEFILRIENNIKDNYFRLFSKQMLLHKLLSKTKIWVLKIETKIDNILHIIRKKAQQLDKDVKKKK